MHTGKEPPKPIALHRHLRSPWPATWRPQCATRLHGAAMTTSLSSKRWPACQALDGRYADPCRYYNGSARTSTYFLGGALLRSRRGWLCSSHRPRQARLHGLLGILILFGKSLKNVLCYGASFSIPMSSLYVTFASMSTDSLGAEKLTPLQDYPITMGCVTTFGKNAALRCDLMRSRNQGFTVLLENFHFKLPDDAVLWAQKDQESATLPLRRARGKTNFFEERLQRKLAELEQCGMQ